MTPIRIVGISGSLRDESVTRQLVSRVLDAAEAQGARTELVDVRDFRRLPYCDGRDGSYGPQADLLIKRLSRADAFVVGTPEYHGGYSGVLKNMLDVAGSAPFKGKLVALVGAAGGRLGAEAAMNQLRVVFKNIESLVLPQQTSAAGDDVNKATGRLNAPFVVSRLEQMGRDLVDMARRLGQAS